MEKYEIHRFLEEYKQKLMDMHQALQIDTKEPRLKELNEEISKIKLLLLEGMEG